MKKDNLCKVKMGKPIKLYMLLNDNLMIIECNYRYTQPIGLKGLN